MKYEISEKDGVVVIKLRGQMYLYTELNELHTKMRERIGIGARQIAVDLGKVSRVNTRGLEVLNEVQKSLRELGGELQLVAPQKKIHTFSLLQQGLLTLWNFKTCDSMEEALKSFSACS